MTEDFFNTELPRSLLRIRQAVAEGIAEFAVDYSERVLEGRHILTSDEARALIREIVAAARRIGGV